MASKTLASDGQESIEEIDVSNATFVDVDADVHALVAQIMSNQSPINNSPEKWDERQPLVCSTSSQLSSGLIGDAGHSAVPSPKSNDDREQNLKRKIDELMMKNKRLEEENEILRQRQKEEEEHTTEEEALVRQRKQSKPSGRDSDWSDDESFLEDADGLIHITDDFAVTTPFLKRFVMASDMSERTKMVLGVYWNETKRDTSFFKLTKARPDEVLINMDDLIPLKRILAIMITHKKIAQDTIIEAWEEYVKRWVQEKLISDRNKRKARNARRNRDN